MRLRAKHAAAHLHSQYRIAVGEANDADRYTISRGARRLREAAQHSGPFCRLTE